MRLHGVFPTVGLLLLLKGPSQYQIFHYMIIVAERIHNNDIIIISITKYKRNNIIIKIIIMLSVKFVVYCLFFVFYGK